MKYQQACKALCRAGPPTASEYRTAAGRECMEVAGSPAQEDGLADSLSNGSLMQCHEIGGCGMQGALTDRPALTAEQLAWLARMPQSARPPSKSKPVLSKLVPKKSWIPGVSKKPKAAASLASGSPRTLHQVGVLRS